MEFICVSLLTLGKRAHARYLIPSRPKRLNPILNRPRRFRQVSRVRGQKSCRSDIEIAREAKKKPIQEIGAKTGIESTDLLPYGHDKVKVSQDFILDSAVRAKQNLSRLLMLNR